MRRPRRRQPLRPRRLGTGKPEGMVGDRVDIEHAVACQRQQVGDALLDTAGPRLMPISVITPGSACGRPTAAVHNYLRSAAAKRARLLTLGSWRGVGGRCGALAK